MLNFGIEIDTLKENAPKLNVWCVYDVTFTGMPKCGYYHQVSFKTDRLNCVENEKLGQRQSGDMVKQKLQVVSRVLKA